MAHTDKLQKQKSRLFLLDIDMAMFKGMCTHTAHTHMLAGSGGQTLI